MGIKLNDKQLKGIDMVIRAIMKKYKFIKGWELYPDHEQYDSVIFLNVIMDYQEFADTYNYYIQPINWRRSASSPATYLGRDKEDYNKDYIDKDKSLYQEIKSIKDDIENTIRELYTNLPQEFISTFFSDSNTKHPRYIMVSYFTDTDDKMSLPI
jgi:hypothetical protein